MPNFIVNWYWKTQVVQMLSTMRRKLKKLLRFSRRPLSRNLWTLLIHQPISTHIHQNSIYRVKRYEFCENFVVVVTHKLYWNIEWIQILIKRFFDITNYGTVKPRFTAPFSVSPNCAVSRGFTVLGYDMLSLCSVTYSQKPSCTTSNYQQR